MSIPDAEQRFLATARVARLATADEDGRPHVVPICFTLVEGRFVTPLNDKPKDVDPRSLRRVRDIEANPHVAVIVDRYTDDWTELGWVQMRGMARLVASPDTDHEPAVDALRSKYSQYADRALDHRPVIVIDPGHVVSITAAAALFGVMHNPIRVSRGRALGNQALSVVFRIGSMLNSSTWGRISNPNPDRNHPLTSDR